jgi:hypothetical protein
MVQQSTSILGGVSNYLLLKRCKLFLGKAQDLTLFSGFVAFLEIVEVCVNPSETCRKEYFGLAGHLALVLFKFSV